MVVTFFRYTVVRHSTDTSVRQRLYITDKVVFRYIHMFQPLGYFVLQKSRHPLLATSQHTCMKFSTAANIIIYTVFQKHVLRTTCYNLDIHDPITVIFGRTVSDKVRNHTMLFSDLTYSASVLPCKIGKPQNAALLHCAGNTVQCLHHS